eukprot:RCo011345
MSDKEALVSHHHRAALRRLPGGAPASPAMHPAVTSSLAPEPHLQKASAPGFLAKIYHGKNSSLSQQEESRSRKNRKSGLGRQKTKQRKKVCAKVRQVPQQEKLDNTDEKM